MAIEVHPLSDALGAEIRGIDPAGDIDDATMAAIRQAWLDNNVLLFRNVSWTPAQHVAFTRRFGPLHIMPRLANEAPVTLPDYPEVFIVSNLVRKGKPVGVRRAGWGWHSDGEDKLVPNMGSMLHAVIVPPEGGDTAFANMYKAGAPGSAGPNCTPSTTPTCHRSPSRKSGTGPMSGIRWSASTRRPAESLSISGAGRSRSKGSGRTRARR